MNLTGRFYDLDDGENITSVVSRNDGNELAFDLSHSDRFHYTVVIKRHDGTLFKGTAISQPGGEVAELTCRVYEEPIDDWLALTEKLCTQLEKFFPIDAVVGVHQLDSTTGLGLFHLTKLSGNLPLQIQPQRIRP
jgi:hypothetical protein